MSDSTALESILSEYDRLHSTFVDFTREVQYLLTRLVYERGLVVASIETRVKDRLSFRNKVIRPDKSYTSFDQITDISGGRIVTFLTSEIDRIDAAIQEEFIVHDEYTADKRRPEKANEFGYLSLHRVISLDSNRAQLTEYRRFGGLRMELQMRSILQHTWAVLQHPYGYKVAEDVPAGLDREFARIASQLEWADEAFSNIHRRVDQFRENLNAKVRNDPASVEIDPYSLESFIANSSIIKEITEAVGSQINVYIDELPLDWKSIVHMLLELGFRNMEDIVIAAHSTRDAIVKLMVGLVRSGKVMGYSTGSILYTLGLVHAFSEGGREGVLKALTGFYPDGDSDVEVDMVVAILSDSS